MFKIFKVLCVERRTMQNEIFVEGNKFKQLIIFCYYKVKNEQKNVNKLKKKLKNFKHCVMSKGGK